MGLGIPPLDIKILLESNPLKSRILVRRLAASALPSRGSPGLQLQELAHGLPVP